MWILILFARMWVFILLASISAIVLMIGAYIWPTEIIELPLAAVTIGMVLRAIGSIVAWIAAFACFAGGFEFMETSDWKADPDWDTSFSAGRVLWGVGVIVVPIALLVMVRIWFDPAPRTSEVLTPQPLMTVEERASAGASCSKQAEPGTADYTQCMRVHTATLEGATRFPDFSKIPADTKADVLAKCHAAFFAGPFAYNRCLANNLAELSRP